MPTHAKSYENTIIYKIVCKNPLVTDFYVGHTTDYRQRLRRHQQDTINKPNRKIYKTINDNGGWDNWDMIIIEKCSLNNVEEAKLREHYWYDTLRPTLNNNMPLLFGLTKYEVKQKCEELGVSLCKFKDVTHKKRIEELEEENKHLKELLTANNIQF